MANLLTIVAALTGSDPRQVADQVGDGGAAGLKALATEVINESLRGTAPAPGRTAADVGYLDGVLLDGSARATATAIGTLDQVRRAMGMDYLSG